ncbi:hypothetical protein MLD38_003886 [Melastoma candidum]|uniref:Uncharacterized protein n=1 Tax=Melastoma candidum TaxID=119954 RepID=A0ACB9S5H4_9MYRT|nr:hypothetical protein MLD38_003886 [Melastoma candidum]
MVKSGPWGLGCSLVILVGFISSAASASLTPRKLDESTAPKPARSVPRALRRRPLPLLPASPARLLLRPRSPPTPRIYNYPPPPSTYIYISGPPGNLYPVEQYFSGAEKGLACGRWVWIGLGLMGVTFLW